MTKDVITATPTESTTKVLRLMIEHNIRNVPVVPLIGQAIDYADGREYQTIGMITEMDLIRFANMKLHESEQ
jgi:CBS domain-containing protein